MLERHLLCERGNIKKFWDRGLSVKEIIFTKEDIGRQDKISISLLLIINKSFK